MSSHKQELKKYLEEISEEAKFTVFKYDSPEKYIIVLKCRVEDNAGPDTYNAWSKDWIEKFSRITSTKWIVRHCFPRVKRMLYRKVFTCHLSCFNKKKLSPTAMNRSKNKNCKAKVDFKVKKINRSTIRHDPCLKDGLNMHIMIDFNHTHSVRTPNSKVYVQSLKSSSEIDEVFYKYFKNGYTATVAKNYHEIRIISEYGKDSERVLRSDYNPDMPHVIDLFKKKKPVELNYESLMMEKKILYEHNGGELVYHHDVNTVVVVTPFMKKVLKRCDLDTVHIDSHVIQNGPVVLLITIPKTLGALPVVCAIFPDQSEARFNRAFLSIKLLLENTKTIFDPKTVIMNDIKDQIAAFEDIFPSKKILASRTSISENIWRLICDDDNRPFKQLRNSTMCLFNSLLRCRDTNEAEKYYLQLIDNNLVKSMEKLKEYLAQIRENRENYFLQVDNVVDWSFRFLKSFLLQKCSQFSTHVMVDVLLNILDKHWSQILYAHLNGRCIIETYTQFLDKNDAVLKNGSNVKEIDKLLHCIEGDDKKLVTYTTDAWYCDCAIGAKGQLCDHLTAALHHSNATDLTADICDDKRAFYSQLLGNDGELLMEMKAVTDVKQEIESQDDICADGISITEDTPHDMEEINDNDSYYYVVTKEDNDPLEGYSIEGAAPIEQVSIEQDPKLSYETALKTLNNEFRRLNKYFKFNPNAANLDTMRRLAKELNKIKPVPKVNLSNMSVELNRYDMEFGD